MNGLRTPGGKVIIQENIANYRLVIYPEDVKY
jgi:hypothetical protein